MHTLHTLVHAASNIRVYVNVSVANHVLIAYLGMYLAFGIAQPKDDVAGHGVLVFRTHIHTQQTQTTNFQNGEFDSHGRVNLSS